MLKLYCQNLVASVSSGWKQHKKFMITNWLFGAFLFITLLTHQLTNQYDGFWTPPYYAAARWELSCGRWLWLYLDRIRGRLCIDPFNTYLALIFLVIGITLVLDIFNMLKRKCAYLISFTFMSSTIVSVFLSYRFMSPTFGLSFLLSVLSAWCFIKLYNKKIGLLLSAVFITLSMGCYQACLACTCLLFIAFYITEALNQRADFKYIGKCILAILLGGIVYKLIWMVHLAAFHMEAGYYNGADSITIGNAITRFPARFIQTYKEFFDYFFHAKFHFNLLQNTPLFVIIFAIILLSLALHFRTALKANLKSGLLGLLAVILIPPACNVTLMIATEVGVSIQMTVALSLFLPVMLCTLFSLHAEKVLKTLSRGLIFCMAFVLYGNIYMTATDLEAIKEGRNASFTLTRTMINSLAEKDYLDADATYLFVGIPSDNPLFWASGIWDNANGYAQFGDFWTSPICLQWIYEGTFRELGLNIKMAPSDSEEYAKVIKSETVRNMPVYPAEQSIQKIDDYIVIKVSNTYSTP